MKYFFLLFAFLLSGCETLKLSDGRKKQIFSPVHAKNISTEGIRKKYEFSSFKIDDFEKNVGSVMGKRSVQFVSPSDVELALNRYPQSYFYFWNSSCSGTATPIKILDSLSRTGEKVFIISLDNYLEVSERRFLGTVFEYLPIYVLNDELYSSSVNKRHIQFIKKVCPQCYEKYRDGVAYSEILLLSNKKVEVLMTKDSRNPIKY